MTEPQRSPSGAVDGFVSEGYGDRPWRCGRKVFRTVYDAHDTLIGVMDTPALAQLVVFAVNDLARFDAPPQNEHSSAVPGE